MNWTSGPKASKLVLQVIEDIADQTNLLALNAAAIEAPCWRGRPGVRGGGGRGKLAEKTMQATREVAQGHRHSERARERRCGRRPRPAGPGHEVGRGGRRVVTAFVSSSEASSGQVQAIAAASRDSPRSASRSVAPSRTSIASPETADAMSSSARSVHSLAEQAKTLIDLMRELGASRAPTVRVPPGPGRALPKPDRPSPQRPRASAAPFLGPAALSPAQPPFPRPSCPSRPAALPRPLAPFVRRLARSEARRPCRLGRSACSRVA